MLCCGCNTLLIGCCNELRVLGLLLLLKDEELAWVLDSLQSLLGNFKVYLFSLNLCRERIIRCLSIDDQLCVGRLGIS